MDDKSKGRKHAALGEMAEYSDYAADALVSEAAILRRCREVRRKLADKRRRNAASAERSDSHHLS